MVEAVIIGYLVIMVGVGIYSHYKIKTPKDYYIAGKKGSFPQVSGSLFATILGGSAILGTIELSRQLGWAALWFLFCASAGLFVLAPISKYVSRYGHFTLPELLGHFFGEQAKMVSSAIIPFAWLGIIAAQIIGAGKIIESTGLLDYQLASVLSGVIFIFYTLIGGQKSIIKTDMFQSIFIITGISTLFFMVSQSAGKPAIPPFTPQALFNSSFTVLDLAILVLTYSVTFVVGPDIYSRIFCAKSEKTAMWSVLSVAVLLIPVSYALTYLGISSLQYEGVSPQINGLISLGGSFLPSWAFALLIAALLSAVMSSADTTLLTASMILSGLAYGTLENRKAFGNTRILIIVLGVLSIIISIYVTSIIQMLLLALAFFSGAFIVPTIAGLLKFKVNRQNVIVAMILGGLIALAGKLTNNYLDKLLGNFIIIAAYLVNIALLSLPFDLIKLKYRKG
ncbi:hypothetical protein MNBD_BACTEROID01-2752 [hydrothermal vent metagenome]|uniref:Sodium-solute symporter n=1 Tax=hydrothermal vent metagenome TaxID=652676 RepID=A0A3B0U7I1_9ZZZZ